MGRRLGQCVQDQSGSEEYTGHKAGDLACQAGINCLCFSAWGMEEGSTLVRSRGTVSEKLGRLAQEWTRGSCITWVNAVICVHCSKCLPPLLQSTWNSISWFWVSRFACYQQIATASLGKAFYPLWKIKLSPTLVVPFGLISPWLASVYCESKLTVN